MTTFEWIILISFIWLMLLVGFLATTINHSRGLKDQELSSKIHPFLQGQKKPIGEALISDFLWIERLSSRQKTAILAYIKDRPSTKVADLVHLPSITGKTVEKLARHFY